MSPTAGITGTCNRFWLSMGTRDSHSSTQQMLSSPTPQASAFMTNTRVKGYVHLSSPILMSLEFLWYILLAFYFIFS